MDLCSINPELNKNYHLESNMGYASKKHIEGIKNHGYTDLHRKTYKLKCLL